MQNTKKRSRLKRRRSKRR